MSIIAVDPYRSTRKAYIVNGSLARVHLGRLEVVYLLLQGSTPI